MPKKIKSKSITTIECEVAIALYFGVRTNIIVPNLSWGFIQHEMDMAVITKSGYLKEIEIKISKADFLKDFEKGHGHIDKLNRITEFYYAMPIDLYTKVKDLIPVNAGVIVCERYHYKEWDGVKYILKERIRADIKKTAIKIKNARKLTVDEQFKISRLGCMRIFNLKQKYITLLNKHDTKI